VSGDFDNDGDIDYVAGNLGLNSNFQATLSEPMLLYAKDINDDRKLDPMIFCYIKAEDGTRKPFPMHTRDDLVSQLISIRKKYPTYKSFGRASVDELWTKQDRENAIALRANHLATSYIENKGNGRFALKPLPVEAQEAPIYGMVSQDVDGDGNLDLLLVGNDYGMEPGGGRHDAFNGLLLKGNGKGGFTNATIAESGFFVKGDAKGLATIRTANDEQLLLATQNQDSLLVFRKKEVQNGNPIKWIIISSNEVSADIIFNNGRKRRIEFYYGSTFLSQSSRKIPMEKDAVRIVITDFKGNKREVMK
jgi:hypothetical protein